MEKLRSIFLVTSIVALLFSCSEEIEPTPYTYTKFFTGENSKTWRIQFLEETLNGSVIDRFSLSCATDDRYTFYSNTERAFEVVTGSRKCNNPSEAAKLTNVWTFANTTATLTMILPFFNSNSTVPLVVRKADDDKMVLETFFNDDDSGSYRIHFELVDED